MARHDHRDRASGRFQKMGDSIQDISNVSGAPSPNTQAVGRHGPSADYESYGDVHGRAPEQIDAQSGEALGQHVSEVPGLPAEIFGGSGVMRHNPSHGGHQQINPHLSGKTPANRYREPYQPGTSVPDTFRVQFGDEDGRHDMAPPVVPNRRHLRPLGQTDNEPAGTFRDDHGGLFRTAE